MSPAGRKSIAGLIEAARIEAATNAVAQIAEWLVVEGHEDIAAAMISRFTDSLEADNG